VFNIAQRLGGSLGVSLLGSLLAARAPVVGPTAALHEIGLVLTGLAGLALIGAFGLRPIRSLMVTNTSPRVTDHQDPAA
jgi:hypothetical protein